MPAGAPVLCTSKGIEVKTLKLMAEILPETLGRTPQEIKQLVNGPILDYVQIGGLDRSA